MDPDMVKRVVKKKKKKLAGHKSNLYLRSLFVVLAHRNVVKVRSKQWFSWHQNTMGVLEYHIQQLWKVMKYILRLNLNNWK